MHDTSLLCIKVQCFQSPRKWVFYNVSVHYTSKSKNIDYIHLFTVDTGMIKALPVACVTPRAGVNSIQSIAIPTPIPCNST